MGLITDPTASTILERDWTNAERHATGDHSHCGSACPQSGRDLRESPIYDRVVIDTLRLYDLVPDVPDDFPPVGRVAPVQKPMPALGTFTKSALQGAAKGLGVKGWSRMNKEQLRAAVADYFENKPTL